MYGYLFRARIGKPQPNVQVKVLLNTHGSVRPSAEEFTRAPFFDALPILSLRYACIVCIARFDVVRFLSTLVEKEDFKRAQFMKGLPKVLPLFPRRVIQQKVFYLRFF